MHKFIECMCGAPDCMITIIKNKKSEILENTETNYHIIYPLYYEDHILYTNKWHFITKYFYWIKRFFKYIYKILRNDIYLVYDINPKLEDLNELQKIDTSIDVENFGNEKFDFYSISNTLKINSYEIPFFVLLNFLFKGYLAADYVKYLNNKGVHKPEYSYIKFKIF